MNTLYIVGIAGFLAIVGCSTARHANEEIPDYINGRPNALVCPDNSPCFQCSHRTAKHYEKLYSEGKWDGGIIFLPLGQEP